MCARARSFLRQHRNAALPSRVILACVNRLAVQHTEDRVSEVWIWFMDIRRWGRLERHKTLASGAAIKQSLRCLVQPSNLMLIVHAWWHTFESVCNWLCLRPHSWFSLAGDWTDCPRWRSGSANTGDSLRPPRVCLGVIGYASTWCGYFSGFLLWQCCWQPRAFIAVCLLHSWAHPAVMSEN